MCTDREGDCIRVTWSHFPVFLLCSPKKYWCWLLFTGFVTFHVQPTINRLYSLMRLVQMVKSFGTVCSISCWEVRWTSDMTAERERERERERFWCAAPLGNVFLLTSASIGSHVTGTLYLTTFKNAPRPPVWCPKFLIWLLHNTQH